MASAISSYEIEALPELEGPAGAESFLPESETEGFLFENEAEQFANPVARIYPDAVMGHLATRAAEAETEDRAAEQFLPLIPLAAAKLLPLAAKLAPMAMKALPKVASAVSRVTPQLTRGISSLGRSLFRNPRTRSLVRTLPTIAQRTIGQVARRSASGSVSPQTAAQILGQQAAQVLRSPQARAQAVKQAAALDQAYHKSTGVTHGNCCHCGTLAGRG